MNGNGTGNLYKRLNAISAEVAKIKPTGKTAPHQGAQPALSIADVEDALRDLFVKHGVVTGYSFTNQPVIVGTRGGSETWQADLNVWMVNMDTPEERIDCRAIDIGSSPSAAVSFALKRLFRSLFHLATEDDENPPSSSKTAKPAVTPQKKSSGAETSPTGSSPSGTSPRSSISAPDTRSGAGADASPLPRPGAGHEAQAPPAAPAPDASAVLGTAVTAHAVVTRAALMARLIDEQHRAGMTTESLRSLAQHLFQKVGANDLTDAELVLLIDEVRGVGLSQKASA